MTGKLLTAEEVATRLVVPKAHVYRLARDGRLPCIELGRYRRFRHEDLDRFLARGGTKEAA